MFGSTNIASLTKYDKLYYIFLTKIFKIILFSYNFDFIWTLYKLVVKIVFINKIENMLDNEHIIIFCGKCEWRIK